MWRENLPVSSAKGCPTMCVTTYSLNGPLPCWLSHPFTVTLTRGSDKIKHFVFFQNCNVGDGKAGTVALVLPLLAQKFMATEQAFDQKLYDCKQSILCAMLVL